VSNLADFTSPLPWTENEDEQHYLPNEPIRIGWCDEGHFYEICELAEANGDDVGNAALIVRAVNSHAALLGAIEAVIAASQEYLPPDGISKDEFINRVLAATDNAKIVAALKIARPAKTEAAHARQYRSQQACLSDGSPPARRVRRNPA
jgi:hypothetical protein